MSSFHFDLQSVLDIREATLREAEIAAEKALRNRDAARAQLDFCVEREREQARILAEHRARLLESDGGPVMGADVLQRMNRIELLSGELELTKDQVFAQSAILKGRETELRKAGEAVAESRREFEVLEKYRDIERQRFELQAEKREEAEIDEVGSFLFQGRRRDSE